MLHFLLLSLCALSSALPTVTPTAVASAPTVKIKNGTVVGSSFGLLDTFLGIPFARPPVGSLRLKPPQTINSAFGTIIATNVPTACPQQGGVGVAVPTSALPSSVASLVASIPALNPNVSTSPQGEDCLTLNIQRPAGSNSTSKLPVVFWIYGGGFEAGSTAMYNGSGFVTQSIALGYPVLYAEVNYRLSGFGFLAGKQLQKDGSTNLGLRDQRLGLQWVQENIAAFGGDPARVTLWGESAGSISVFDQTIINRGNNFYKTGPLFQAAIMDSGSVIPAQTVASAKAQAVYDQVVSVAGCSSAKNSLTCLRSIPYETFLNAVNSLPGIFSYQSVNLAYLPRPDPASSFFPVSPDLAVKAKNFTRVPIIIGDQQDEGTLFSLVQSNISTTAQLVTYLKSYFPATSLKLVTQLVNTYPDDASAGSPFNTGAANEIYPQFKRLAAILGDATFTLTRRVYLASVVPHVPAWSYIATYFYGTPVLGTFHGSDLLELYYNAPFPSPMISILTYYISFVNFLNPNTITTLSTLPTDPLQIEWPQWDPQSVQLLNFGSASNNLTTDDFRNTSYTFLRTHSSSFNV